ncbi:MAG: hypothetical protein HC884_10300 [Chloroflexaceae bacterium]|nr:hypothetical protein [Chloroflexaceae bacterium]
MEKREIPPPDLVPAPAVKRNAFKEFSRRANYYASSLAVPCAVVGGIAGVALQVTGHVSGGPIWLMGAWIGAMLGMVAGYLYALLTSRRML